MIYLKSVLAGISAVVLFVVVLLLGFRIALFVMARQSGSAGIGGVFGSISALLILALASLIFVAGFYWEFRRALR